MRSRSSIACRVPTRFFQSHTDTSVFQREAPEGLSPCSRSNSYNIVLVQYYMDISLDEVMTNCSTIKREIIFRKQPGFISILHNKKVYIYRAFVFKSKKLMFKVNMSPVCGFSF